MSSPHHPLFARMYDIVMMPSDRMGIRRQRRHLCRRAAGTDYRLPATVSVRQIETIDASSRK